MTEEDESIKLIKIQRKMFSQLKTHTTKSTKDYERLIIVFTIDYCKCLLMLSNYIIWKNYGGIGGKTIQFSYVFRSTITTTQF